MIARLATRSSITSRLRAKPGLRLERAKQLLARTRHDVTRVASLSGFDSPQYFCRAFRQNVGTAPLKYRASPGASRATVGAG
jgi:transcriptional regulator GlxA family with amidase domain